MLFTFSRKRIVSSVHQMIVLMNFFEQMRFWPPEFVSSTSYRWVKYNIHTSRCTAVRKSKSKSKFFCYLLLFLSLTCPPGSRICPFFSQVSWGSGSPCAWQVNIAVVPKGRATDCGGWTNSAGAKRRRKQRVRNRKLNNNKVTLIKDKKKTKRAQRVSRPFCYLFYRYIDK